MFDSTKSSTGLRELKELSIEGSFQVVEVSGNAILELYPAIDWEKLGIHVGYINRELHSPSLLLWLLSEIKQQRYTTEYIWVAEHDTGKIWHKICVFADL